LLVVCCALFAQSDRGTITGTVSDQAGALIPGAKVVANNAATGVQFSTETTQTGNYTIPSVPSGTYDINVEVQGFRKYQQTGVTVQVAQTARIDIVMQVGNTTESVTVSADAPLLKTENAAQSTTISGEQINDLPLNFAIGQGAVRNPLSFVQLAPGAAINGWNDIRINGAPSNTFRIIFEGQDTTSALNPRVSDESQASVEAIQEFTLQTSSYAAEFGQVGGGLFNFTSKSGTNAIHGSAYEYFVHEKLNARNGFPNPGDRPQVRRHDFGGSIGGPVVLPKIYNGRDRTFFFANYENYRNRENKFNGLGTLPTDAMRNGDFSAMLTGRVLGTDPLGRPIMENTIYDPNTSRVVNGQVVRDPFPNNIIPQNRFDPVAKNVQALVPATTNGNLINNFERRYSFRKIQAIPSFKIDHSFSDSQKMSVYYSFQKTDKDNGQDDGLPDPISPRRDQLIRSHTVRVNHDWTARPTLLLHFGAGYQRYHNPDASPQSIQDYDAGQLGFQGQVGSGFPRLTSLTNSFGGLPNIGPTNRTLYLQDKPTAVFSATYIRGNHTYKAGGDWRIDTFTNLSTGGVAGNYAFDPQQTGLPSTQGQNLQGGAVGHPYASFLLGLVNSASIANPAAPQYRRTTWGFFLQDTWKVTRKLTLDYGVRYDLQNPARELNHRTSAFAPTIANPNAGGLLGATIYEGDGPGRCNCNLVGTYPYAIAPRLGVAYQLSPKTVIRGGWGVSYAQLTGFNYIGGGNSQGMGFNSIPVTSPGFGDPALLLRNGLTGQYNPAELFGASYDPGLLVAPGQIKNATAIFDPNGGRPPRQVSWNISVQREVMRDLVVEAAYVGNRGAWFRADGLVDYNANTAGRLQGFGLDINNAADRALLTSRLDSPQVIARGFKAPYAGFPTSSTLAQSLRPYPQFGTIPSMWAPLGNTWYDSLQVQATKRYSYGLTFTAAYTWSKNLTNVEDQDGTIVPTNDVFNRQNQKSLSREDQPHVFVTSFNYTLPSFGFMRTNAFARQVLSGWTFGGILRYSSGKPIRVPQAQNSLNSILFRSGVNASRVPGQPLFTKDLDCGCIDPNKDFVLNPNAWTDPPAGQFGTAANYYNDYRYARRPDEQLSLGKEFRITESKRLQIRAEFFNVFNRVALNNPDSTNALAKQVADSNGVPTSGFGRISTGGVFADRPARSGQIVARFQF
jgi:hypothetical protein